MNCEEIRIELSLESCSNDPVVLAHLDKCPNCRTARDEFGELRTQLTLLAKPQYSLRNEYKLREAIATELADTRQTIWFDRSFMQWTGTKILPVFAGTVASLVIGFGLLGFLFSDMNRTSTVAGSRSSQVDRTIIASSNASPRNEGSDPIFPDEYARNRMQFAAESPSVNPQGSLVSISNALRAEGRSPDGVVVVANVFGDGLARIEEVVSPTKSRKAIDDLQKALDADLGDAPFVPASLDGRSDNVRVVLRFQQVDVQTSPSPKGKPKRK